MNEEETNEVFCELCYSILPIDDLGEIRCIEKGESYGCCDPKHEQNLMNATVLLKWYHQGKIRGL